MRCIAFLLLLVAASAFAGDVYTPPVLIGVRGDGSGRRSNEPITFPDAKTKWTRVETPHFIVISAASERRTRTIAQNLETLAATLAALHPRFRTAPTPTRVLVFNRRRESQPYFDLLLNRKNAHAAGIFVAQRNGGTMLIDDSRDWRADRTPYHELIHNLLATRDDRIPLWIEEGLAEYFSNAEVGNGTIRTGMPIKEHLEVLRRRTSMPIAGLFRVRREADAYNVPSGQAIFYAESWAAVNWLMQTDHDAFYEFLRDVETGVDPATALQARYHRTLRDLETAITSVAMVERNWNGVIQKVPDVRPSIDSKPIERAEVLYQLGRFLRGVNDNSREAIRHFDAALAANPKHGRALAEFGRYDEAIAATPDDPEVHLIFAEALLGRAIGRLAGVADLPADAAIKFRQARGLIECAMALGANDGRAYGDLGTTWIVETDPAPGIAALEKARDLAPSRSDFALHLFAMYRRTGDLAKADALFAQLDRARDEQAGYAARATLVRIELDRANELTKGQRLDEAAAIVRRLADITKDPAAKRDLEGQAEGIDRVAETNRQITAYNSAISMVNAGNYRDARKTLDALLAKATDPEIVRDAKKLRTEIAKLK
jgi:tetratricopeptide (TPR) repeat protein